MYVVLFNRVLKEVEKLRVDSRVAKGKTEVFQMNVDGSVFSEYPGTKVRGGDGEKKEERGREREGERREREGGREEEERGRERGGGKRGKEKGGKERRGRGGKEEGKRRERKGGREEQGDRGKRRRMTVMVLYCG